MNISVDHSGLGPTLRNTILGQARKKLILKYLITSISDILQPSQSQTVSRKLEIDFVGMAMHANSVGIVMFSTKC